VWGPFPGNTIWTGLAGLATPANSGDPIVLYDRQAGRWLISQFAIPEPRYGPFLPVCGRLNDSDPTGSWYRYAFTWPDNAINDYPKFGIWPDGYYMTVNQFNAAGTAWLGAGVAALDRTSMLSGRPPYPVFQPLFRECQLRRHAAVRPGRPVPPPGAPAYFGEVDDSSTIGPNDAFRVWEFHTDWATPANTTFGLSGQPNQVLDVAPSPPSASGRGVAYPSPGPRRASTPSETG